jgi:hypothetical protein
MGAAYGIQSNQVSVCSLQSSCTMSLLCTIVDTDTICLLGRWRSDKMLRYSNVQIFPLVAPFAAQILCHGHFTLIPNNPTVGNGGSNRIHATWT